MHFAAAVALVSAVVVSAADFNVTVGDGGALAFNPTSVTAAVGDIIHFEFRAKNHSVTQSTFASPCTLQSTPSVGIDSGFQAVAPGATAFPSWSITLNDTAPLWFFCNQKIPANHCQAGMVFAVNPTAEKSFDAFQAAAKASASASNSSSSAAPSGTATGTGTSPTATGAGSGSGAPKPTQSGNSALGLSGSAAGILAAVGLMAGLVL
jgi:plastocyanin